MAFPNVVGDGTADQFDALLSDGRSRVRAESQTAALELASGWRGAYYPLPPDTREEYPNETTDATLRVRGHSYPDRQQLSYCSVQEQPD